MNKLQNALYFGISIVNKYQKVYTNMEMNDQLLKEKSIIHRLNCQDYTMKYVSTTQETSFTQIGGVDMHLKMVIAWLREQ